MTDFYIKDCGSLVLFTPANERAREWTDENMSVESWQWQGSAFAVERRYAGNLIEGIEDSGFVIGPHRSEAEERREHDRIMTTVMTRYYDARRHYHRRVRGFLFGEVGEDVWVYKPGEL